MANLAELEELFRARHIDFGSPGFYDERPFVEAEQKDKTFLEKYAEYIELRQYSQDYLDRARVVANQAAQFLSRELATHNCVGACIDASGTLMRMLEKEGIWSYMIGGATIVTFPVESRQATAYFWPFVHPRNPAKTGHLWLRVPPFAVLDVSLAIQPWSPQRKKCIPPLIMSEDSVPASVDIEDLIEPEMIAYLRRLHGRAPTMDNIGPIHANTMRKFPAFVIEQQGLSIKYIPTHVSAMDQPLEKMRNLRLGDKYPEQLYAGFKASQQ